MSNLRGSRAAFAAVLLLAGLAATACSTREQHANGPQHATFTYTCCTKADIERVWHPGDVITLHWIISDGPPSTSSDAVPVTLSADLSGPFSGVDTLKKESSDLHAHDVPRSLVAAPIHTTNRAGQAPISTITLPATAGAGFYNLRFQVESPGANFSGASIIRVVVVEPTR